jgi:hypothetical protein
MEPLGPTKTSREFRCYFLWPELYCGLFLSERPSVWKVYAFWGCEFEQGKMQLPTQRRGERCGGNFLGPSLRTVHFLVEIPQLTPRAAMGLHKYSGLTTHQQRGRQAL